MVKHGFCKAEIAGSSPVESYPFMNTNSPIDPLYWFKSQPPNLLILARSEEGEMIAVDRLHKWRFASEAANGVVLCEFVGGSNDGRGFFLTEPTATAAERVD